jgi:hypothetical protein
MASDEAPPVWVTEQHQESDLHGTSQGLMTGLPPIISASHSLLDKARPYFEVSTQDVIAHLKAASTPSKRDFGNNLDLYGALWVPASVAFLAFAFGSLTTWLRTNRDFEYNFGSLVSAFFWLMGFVFGAPFLFKYWGEDQEVVNLMSLFGYSTIYIVPPALLCVFLGKKFGFVIVLIGAIVGAYSLSQKTSGKNILALPGNSARGGNKIALFNRFGLLYLILHLILHLICFL